MTDVTVSGTIPTRPTGPKTERVEVARGSDGRPILIPRALVLATAYAWRAALIGLVLYGLGFIVLGSTQQVTTPLLLAVLIAAVLNPLYHLLTRLRIPRLLAAVISVLVLVLVVLGALYFVGQSIASGVGELAGQAGTGLDQLIRDAASAAGISEERADQFVEQARSGLSGLGGQLGSGVLAAGSTALTVVSGAVLALFATLFFLADGQRIWGFLVGLLPQEGREPADVAGRRAWRAVGSYVRVLPIVALVDAILIGGGAAILGVPFALPIGVLTFFAAFLPVVGAVVAGAAAVLVALTGGITTAVIMLVIVILVQQLEGNVLQPLLLGRSLQLHPLAVVGSTALGIVLAGIVGGILAVPVVAGLVVAITSLRVGEAERRERMRREGREPPEDPTEESLDDVRKENAEAEGQPAPRQDAPHP